MIVYNDYDLIKYNDYVSMLEWLGGEEPCESEVWGVARNHTDVPCFENILYGLVLSNIESIVHDKFEINIDLFINGRDTHLYINDEEVYTLDDFKLEIKKGKVLNEV